MADVPLTDDSSDHDDVALGRLLDEVAERAKHGEDLNIDAIIRDHPDLAAEIRLLWPTLQAVERSADRPQTLLDSVTPHRGRYPLAHWVISD